MSRLDGLDVSFDDARRMLTISHPLVPGQPLTIVIPRAKIYEDPGTRLLQLELHAKGTVKTIRVEGLSAPSVLVSLRNALIDLSMVSASIVVGRYHNDLVRALGRETRRDVDTHTCDGRIMTSDIESLMESVDAARSEIVLCLMGASGIGKTEGIEAFAKRHSRQVVHLIASQVLPTEVSGMTMPNQETHAMDVFDHSRISHMRDGDILFLDELLKGQQQVLSACLTMVQERRLMSGTPLPDVIIVAAANPLASPKMLPLEIRQRFMFVDVSFDADSWCRYMEKRGVPHPERVAASLVTDHDGSDWNTLTPRTATKLLQWMIDARSNDTEGVVRNVVTNMFDGSVRRTLESCLEDDDEKARKTPMQQAVGKVRELMRDLPEADDAYEEVRRGRVTELLDDEALYSDGDKIAELLRLIGNLSDGDEILKALKEETVTLGEF